MPGRIAKRTVDALRPGETAWDAELKGFGVRRRGGAAAVYFVKCRVGGGRKARQRWVSIGKHGSPWTPDTARAEARRLLGLAGHGIDPKSLSEGDQRQVTVSEVCDRYLEASPHIVLPGKGRPKKVSSIEADRSNIERHVKPLLGSRRADTLQRVDIEKFQADVAAGKSRQTLKTRPRGVARVRGGRPIASRAVAVLGAAYAWAVRHRIVASNPVRGVTLYKPERRERFLSGEELRRLGEAMDAAETQWKSWQSRLLHDPRAPRTGEGPVAIAALRLLILTGARKSEVLSLRWQWIDFDRRLIRLPDSKTGAKAIPLGAPALKVLEMQSPVEGNPYVFPGDKIGSHLVGLPRIWTRIKLRAGLTHVRLHDLRHSFASVAVAGGDSLYLVGKVLGHRQARTTERYSHIHDDPLLAVADRAAQQIEAAMKGKSVKLVAMPIR